MISTLTQDIEKYVTLAYKSDPVLVREWHVTAGAGLGRCIARTVEDLKACSSLKFYVVHEDGKFVGYFGLEFHGRYMPTIFIHPDYRHLKFEFWKLIEAAAAEFWQAGIYAKNTPCVKFYSKMGQEIARIKTADGEAALFEFQRSA